MYCPAKASRSIHDHCKKQEQSDSNKSNTPYHIVVSFFTVASALHFVEDFLLGRDALFRSCAAISSVPDSLCFPLFTQAINEILSTSPCHCLVGFPLHPAIASFPLGAPASTAHSLSALLSSFRLSGSPPLGMTSLLLACTLFSNLILNP